MIETNTILIGDCLEKLKELPDHSVDCIVTSPPYWSQRNYGVDGQLGNEPTFAEYVEKLVAVFRECRRVLKNTGTLWLNLGDKMVNKQLLLLPHGVAMALQDDRWILRQEIVWEKPNVTPESVKDRCTRSHEYIFMFAKAKHYFYDHEAIKEPSVSVNDKRIGTGRIDYGSQETSKCQGNNGTGQKSFVTVNATRNKRSVWIVTTRGFQGAHFATFPPDLIEPMIQAGTCEHGYCCSCGAPYERLVETHRQHDRPTDRPTKDACAEQGSNVQRLHRHRHTAPLSGEGTTVFTKTLGWNTTCQCEVNTPVPGVVLDPFMGAGTTAVVAQKLGRQWIGIELNPEYAELAMTRIAGSNGEKHHHRASQRSGSRQSKEAATLAAFL